MSKLEHKKLVKLLKMAYSGERAAAYAYIGHANSVKDETQAQDIREIEQDEWHHRSDVKKIMDTYDIKPSWFLEIQQAVIGRVIGASCHLIGWFMPYYFAGRLESGNVCEYFKMMHYFEELKIYEHHEVLYEMGLKEAEHEVFFLEAIKDHAAMPFFEKYLNWGNARSYNDLKFDADNSLDMSSDHCKQSKLGRLKLFDSGQLRQK